MLPPSINFSYPRFKTEEDEKSFKGYGIRFGFNAIKSMSGDMGEFLQEREKGLFKDLKDFSRRAGNFFNKGKIEKMCESGVFDELNDNRYGSLSIIKWHLQNLKSEIENQQNLFGSELEDNIPQDVLDVDDWGDKTEREFNAVGFYFHNHPLDTYLPRLIKAGIKRLSSLREYMVDRGKAELSNKKICVMVENSFVKYSRNNKLYLTARVSEKGDSFDIPFFGNKNMSVEEAHDILKSAKANRVPVVVSVNVALEERGTRLRVYSQEFFEIESFLSNIRGDVILVIDTSKMISRSSELKMEKENKEIFNNNKITQEEFEKRQSNVFVHKVSSRMEELKSYLSSIQSDQGKSSVGMKIILKNGDDIIESKKLDGKYLFTPVSENHLKTMDGIISVQEEKIE
jgi:DNA polymerase-3 subunit alpha